MTATVEELAPRSEDQVRAHLAAGKLVEGLQHMSYWSMDYQALYDRAVAAGCLVGHEGQIGGPKGRFFERVKVAALDWDGSDPVRVIG